LYKGENLFRPGAETGGLLGHTFREKSPFRGVPH